MMNPFFFCVIFSLSCIGNALGQQPTSSFEDFQIKQVSQLMAQHAEAPLAAKKQIEFKLAALEHSLDGKPVERTLEMLVVYFEFRVTYHTQINDPIGIQKAQASIGYLTAQLEAKKQTPTSH